MLYNGLKDDMNSFAKFVYIYEFIIKKLGKEKEFSLQFPDAFYLYKHELKNQMKYAKRIDMNALPINNKHTLYFTKQKVQVLDFIRHFRNSFVHGLLEHKSQKLFVSDKFRTFNTSIGYLDYMSVKKFIVEIIKEYENNK